MNTRTPLLHSKTRKFKQPGTQRLSSLNTRGWAKVLCHGVYDGLQGTFQEVLDSLLRRAPCCRN